MVDLSKKDHADDPQLNARQTKTIITGGLAHLLHDGFTDMLYVFFPIWQGALGLSFAEVGFLKTLFSGTMAFFQVPSGLLAGGATGKFVCGVLAARLGALRTVITTEVLTALCIYSMRILSLRDALFLAPLLGLALNGTSSALYGSVPELVPRDQQKQAFAIFYTATIGAGAISPSIYGLISDAIGITTTVMIIAGVVLLTIPLTLPLRTKLRH